MDTWLGCPSAVEELEQAHGGVGAGAVLDSKVPKFQRSPGPKLPSWIGWQTCLGRWRVAVRYGAMSVLGS